MKTSTLSVLLVFFSLATCFGQDVPFFSQKLNNSFFYNPALAGTRSGFASVAYRMLWNGITESDAPKVMHFSVHSPVQVGKLGIGANVYRQTFEVFNNTSVSGAVAYHLLLADQTVLSFGLAGEHSSLNFNPDAVRALHQEDPAYIRLQDERFNFDVNFGMNLTYKGSKLGLSYNRIRSRFTNEFEQSTSDFMVASLFHTIRVGYRNSTLEPMVMVNTNFEGITFTDLGLFYNMFDRLMLGGGYRFNSMNPGNALFAGTAAIKVAHTTIGYTYERMVGTLGRELGNTHEFTIGIGFNQRQTLYQDTYIADPSENNKIRNRKKSVQY